MNQKTSSRSANKLFPLVLLLSLLLSNAKLSGVLTAYAQTGNALVETIPYLGLTFTYPPNWILQPIPYLDFGFRISPPGTILDPVGHPLSGGYIGADVYPETNSEWLQFVSLHKDGETILISGHGGILLSRPLLNTMEWHITAYGRHHVIRVVYGENDQVLLDTFKEIVQNVSFTGVYVAEPEVDFNTLENLSNSALSGLSDFPSLKQPFSNGPGRIINGYDDGNFHTGGDKYALDVCQGSDCNASEIDDIVIAPTDMTLIWTGKSNNQQTVNDFHIFEISSDSTQKLCISMGHFKLTDSTLTVGKTVARGAEIGRVVNYVPSIEHIHMGLHTVPINQGCAGSTRTAIPYDGNNGGWSLDGVDYPIGQNHSGKAVISTNCFIDELDDPALDPRWHWVREDPTHWSLTAAPGYIRIVTQAKDIYESQNSAPLLLQSLSQFSSDNFEIQTRIIIKPTANFQQGGLVIYGDDDNYVRFTYAYINGPTFEFGKEVNGVFQPIQVPAPPAITDFHLRIVKSGLDYSAYYSEDGINWTGIGTHFNVNISPVEVGLSAFNSYHTVEIPADFDYFRMTGDLSDFTDVHVQIGGVNKGMYAVPAYPSLVKNYAGIVDGPVKIVSTNSENIFASQRAIYGKSFNEFMGYPVDQFSTEYWFPWYDNVYMKTWILVGNPSPTQNAYVDISIGGVKKGNTYTIPPNGKITPRFVGIVNGPVKVVSVTGDGTPSPIKIFTSERSLYGSSFNEMMGYPVEQFSTEYWFPWYDNVGMSTWVLVGNPSSTDTAYVDIYIGGVKQGDTFTILPNGKITPRFAGVLNGPVKVVSVTGQGTDTPLKVFTSERSTYSSSFNEMMGYPVEQFTTEYEYTWYDNVGMSTWILVGNPSATDTAYVDIYIGGVKQGNTFTILPNGKITPRFTQNTGPVKVVSVTGDGTPTPVNIFTSERTLYGPSFNEMMGYPADQLSTEYWFPWYDNLSMKSEILIGKP